MGVLVWSLRGTLPEAMSPVMRLGILVLSGVVVYGVIARRGVRWAYEFFGLSPGSTDRLVL